MSLLIACTYDNKDEGIEILPITVTSKQNNKLRVVSLSCDSKAINDSIYKVDYSIKRVFIVDDRCASQFQSHYVFNLPMPIHIQQEIFIERYFNEAYHGKGHMNGIGRVMKNLVY